MAAQIHTQLFKEYSSALIKDLQLLKKFKLPEIHKWKIDWEVVKNAGSAKNTNSLKQIKELELLFSSSQKPIIYFFEAEKKTAAALFKQFTKIKKGQSVINDDSFFNISFVPKEFTASRYLYVGSRKKNGHTRLIEHLGLRNNGKTGALHLLKTLKKMRPNIVFNYCILSEKQQSLTEHIEHVVYKKLKPFIGKEPLKQTIKKSATKKRS